MVFDLILILVGISLIIWRNDIGRAMMEAQHKNFGTKFSEKELREEPLGCVIMGVLLMAFVAYRHIIKGY